MRQNLEIYLAGGMTGLSLSEQCEWRDYIKKILEDINPHCFCINPIDYYSEFDIVPKYDSDREVMEYDLYRLENSDLVIVNFNSPKSLGTMAELGFAKARKIKVLGLNESAVSLHPWQRDICEKIFYDIDELISYVIGYYF